MPCLYTHFSQAAKPAPPPDSRLVSLVAEFYAALPRALEKVFIIDAQGQSVIHPDPKIRKNVAELFTHEQAPYNERINRALEETREAKDFCCAPGSYEGLKAAFVFMSVDEKNKPFLGPNAPYIQELRFSFDHETAHGAIPDGLFGYKLIPESIADAHGIINHYRHYGTETDVEQHLMMRRTQDMIFKGSVNWFTAPIIEEIIKHKDNYDFTQLSTEESMQLAHRFARLHTRERTMYERLEKDYAPLTNLPNRRNAEPEELYRPLADIVLATSWPETFRWGAAVLSAAIEGRATHPLTHAPVVLEKRKWQKTVRKLKKMQSDYNAGDVFFGFKEKPKTKPAARTMNSGK